MIDVKNILVIFAIIGCFLFSGCIGGESEGNSEASFPVENDSQSIQFSGFILHESDVRGLMDDRWNNFLYFVSNDTQFYTETSYEFIQYNQSAGIYYVDLGSDYVTREPPSLDFRIVGEKRNWDDGEYSGYYEIFRYDSDPESDFKFLSLDWKGMAESVFTKNMEYGTQKIGTNCFHITMPENTYDVQEVEEEIEEVGQITELFFITSDYEWVCVHVESYDENTLEEAIRIAEIIMGRL
ncbi:hypothetical protein [uncultured Methanolobus sp.]|uniref:hypothetical protein n=1 Tax=uncultured Methanolobus sp. TaxID=218300 RepID=UPI00374A0DF7